MTPRPFCWSGCPERRHRLEIPALPSIDRSAPVASNGDEAGRAKNRRVVLVKFELRQLRLRRLRPHYDTASAARLACSSMEASSPKARVARAAASSSGRFMR